MALNIKNDRVCALAKEAARRTGRTQVSVLEAALARYLDSLDDVDSGESAVRANRRFDEAQRIVEEFAATITDDDRAAVKRDMVEMYDEWGLPVA